jgi:outer membrane biosynthesis protein TonB
MSLQQQKDLLDKLGNLGESIPGLSVDPIVENLAKKSEELKTVTQSIDSEEEEEKERAKRSEKKGKTPEEREAQKAERQKKQEEARKKAETQKKKIIETYKNNIKETVKEKITEIKQSYKVFKDSIESIPPDVTALIANIALPPAITVPPGAPNPIYAINLTKQGKNTLGRTLNSAIVAFTEMLKAANAIKFEIPKPILDLFDKISTVNGIISSIPI